MYRFFREKINTEPLLIYTWQIKLIDIGEKNNGAARLDLWEIFLL